MKKNYQLSLDKEKVEILQPWLEKKGMTFSGFVNESVVEMVETIETLDIPESLEKMPLGVFLGKFARVVKGMKVKP